MTEHIPRPPRIARLPRIWREGDPVPPPAPEQKPPRIARIHEQEQAPRVTAFMTERGSIYTYDEQGHTTRHKAKTGEQFEPQDLTVFIHMDPEAEELFTEMIRHNKDKTKRVYVLERQSDDTPRKIRRLEDVRNPDELYLAVCRTDEVGNIIPGGTLIKSRKATLQPQLGAYAYDTRHFRAENGDQMTERHLGHKVTAIR